MQAEYLLKSNEPFSSPLFSSWFVTCLENLGKGTEADLSIVKALEYFPDSYTLHGQYAKRLQARGEAERARRHYEFMRGNWPHVDLAWTEEIKLLLALNRPQEAESLLAGLDERFPASMEACRLAAERLIRKRDWENALEKWAQFRKKFPSSIYGFRRAIDIFMAIGRVREADALARTMHPDSEAISGSCFVRRADSPDVFIVFSAFDIRMGEFPGGDRLFTPEAFGANIIIVHDFRKLWYLEGIEGLGKNFSDAAKALGDIRDSLLGNGGHTICYGNSMGAYGACLYGSLIGADICLAPGLQAFAPNPVGTFKKYSGKRPHLEDYIRKAQNTYFHIMVGEREFGDLFGCMRLANIQNVNLETVRNFGHGVTAYFAAKKGIREAVHFYLDGLRSNNGYKDRLIAGKHRPRFAELDNLGNLHAFPRIGAWLYAALVALTYPARKNHARMAERLLDLAAQERPSYIRGYLYEMAARLLHHAGIKEKALEIGEMACSCNPANPYASEFLTQVALELKQYDSAWRHASQAASLRNTTLAQGMYRPNRCYDRSLEALENLGASHLAVELADIWLQRRGLTVAEQNLINAARKRSCMHLKAAGSSGHEEVLLYSGSEGWRWKVSAYFWEQAGCPGDAARALRKYLALKPGDLALALKVIDLYRKADDDISAAEVARGQIEKKPWGAGYRRLAQIAERAGDLSEALALCIKAREVEPQNAFHDLMLAELYGKLGDYAKARVYALAHLDDSKMGKYARDSLELIRKLENGEVTVGDASNPAGKKPPINLPRERDALYLALDLEPECRDLRLRLAKNLRTMTFTGALKVLDEGLEMDPEWEEGRILRDQYADEQAEWRKAREAGKQG